MTDKTDKEIICAEIEKLRKEYDIDTTPIAKYQIAQAILNRLSDVIDSMQEEPVSQDLEEASKEYAYTNWESDDYHEGAAEGLPFDAIGHTERTFKAGAKWQKEKLVTWLTRESDFLIQELKKGNKAYGLPEQYRAQLYKEIVNKLKEE